MLPAFSELRCAWYEEQCTLAEFCAYLARYVVAHVDLAAEARVKLRLAAAADLAADEASASDAERTRGRVPYGRLRTSGAAEQRLENGRSVHQRCFSQRRSIVGPQLPVVLVFELANTFLQLALFALRR